LYEKRGGKIPRILPMIKGFLAAKSGAEGIGRGLLFCRENPPCLLSVFERAIVGFYDIEFLSRASLFYLG